MLRKTFCGLVSGILLVGMLTLNIKLLKASGTIYIRADGSIRPDDGRIVTEDKIHYYFNQAEIHDPIVVERDGIVVDGLGGTLEGEGWGSGTGIYLKNRNNVTIKNMTIEIFEYNIYLDGSSYCSIFQTNIKIALGYGMRLYCSSNNNITGNNVTNNNDNGIFLYYSSHHNTITGNNVTNNNDNGIRLYESSNNNITGNNVTNNYDNGILLNESSNNNITGNNVTNNYDGIVLSYPSHHNTITGNNVTNNNDNGIRLYCSSNNTITGNNVTNNNDNGILLDESSNNNIYENSITYNGIGISALGLSSSNYICHNDFVNNEDQCLHNGLNFWDDGSEGNYWSDYEGIDQDGDGIGDTETPHHNDGYPYVIPLGSIPVYFEETMYFCSIDGSMTLSRFGMSEEKTLGFNIAGEGYINLTIPRKFLDGQFKVVIGNDPLPCILWWNDTYTSICFTYDEEGLHNVKVIADISTETPFESPDISMKFDVGPSFAGNYNLTVPRTLLDGQFKIIVNDVIVPSILSWNKTYTSIYFAYSEEDFHSITVIAKNSIQRFPDINGDRTVNILDIAAVALQFGKKLD